MEDERGAISQLGDLALGNLLNDLGVSSHPSQVGSVVGGAASSKSQILEQDQIYNDRYEDDDFDMGELPEDGSYEGDVYKVQNQASQDRYYRMGMQEMNKASTMGRVRGEVDDFDDEEEEEDKGDSSIIKVKKEDTPSSSELRTPTPPPREVDVTEYWPGFEQGRILNFTDLFIAPAQKRRRLVDRGASFRQVPEEDLPVPRSTREDLMQPDVAQQMKRGKVGLVGEIVKEMRGNDDDYAELNKHLGSAALDNVVLDDWESRIVWDASERTEVAPLPVNVHRPINTALESGEWLKGIIWDEGTEPDTRYERFGDDARNAGRRRGKGHLARTSRCTCHLAKGSSSSRRIGSFQSEQ
jgi:hypothetical protein